MNKAFDQDKKELLTSCFLYSVGICGLFVFSWGVSQYVDCNMKEGVYSEPLKKRSCSKRRVKSKSERLKFFQKRRQKE